MQKYFVYVRKSTDNEDRQVLSIEAQLEELKIFIKSLDEDILVVDEYTESKTAKDPGRAIFNKMVSRIEKGDASGIIAWHPDRLARNSIDGGKIIHLIDKGLIKDLKFPTYRFDSSAQGKFMLNIIFGQSKYYVDNLSENVKRGIRHKLRRGEWTNYAPIGYLNNYKTRNIEIDPARGPIIKKLFEEYLTGKYTLKELGDLSIKLNLVTRSKGNSLAISSIRNILSNYAYCGYISNHGELFEGKFEPIISKDIFDKVQVILNKKSRPKKTKHNFVFLGLIKCDICGAMITAETQKGHYYYRCTKKKGNCDLKYLREEKLTDQINKKLEKIKVSDDLQKYFKSKILETKNSLLGDTNQEKNKIYKKLNKQEIQMSRLMDIYLEGGISKYEYCQKKQKQFEQKHKLQKQISFLEKGQFLWLEHLQEFINSLGEVKTVIKTDNLEDKRKFLEKIGSNFSLGHFGAKVNSNPAVFSKKTTPMKTEEKRGGGRSAPLRKGQTATNKNQLKTRKPVFKMDFNNFWEVLTEINNSKNSTLEKSTMWWTQLESNQ